MADNPYRHFNDLKSTCYMRLWELEEGDGGMVEGRGFAGGRDWDDEDSGSESGESDISDDEVHAGGLGLHLPNAANGRRGVEEVAIPPPVQRPNRRALAEQPRDIRIEIVNFARAGVANQRIFENVVQRPRGAPPPVPVPPRRQNAQGPRAGRANLPRVPGFPHGARDLRAHVRADARAQLEAHDSGDEAEDEGEDEADDEVEMVRPAAAPGQGNEAAQQPAPVRAMGLERFLELAQQDAEDEWDSDELEEIEVLPNDVRRDRRQARR